MLSLFVSALLLGLVFNATPGAVFAETVRHGLRGGFRPALAVQVGSLVGDATWAVLGLLSIALALQWDLLRRPLGLAGAAYLAWLAWDSWQAARTVRPLPGAPGVPGASGASSIGGAPGGHAPQADDRLAARPLRAGVLLSLTNPQNLAYWAAIGGAMGALGIARPAAVHYAVFFAGFMAASLLWAVVCAALVDRLFRRAGVGWARFTYRLCAAALLAMALATLHDLVQPGAAPVGPPGPAAAAVNSATR